MKRIAVIGAGPSGIVAAKYLVDEDCFEAVDVFEQRDKVGGLWNYTPETLDFLPKVPLTDPFEYEEQFISAATTNGGRASGGKRTFISPMYDRLEVNIPRFQMRFRDLEFAPGQQLFPKHEAVLQYLEEYARDIKHLIRFNCSVESITKDGEQWWTLTYKDLRTGTTSSSIYDVVVVSSGHYDLPFIPDDIEGMAEFEKAYPGSIQHSKYYREPSIYSGKQVVVVGNSNSGMDVALQSAETAQLPVTLSCKKNSPFLKYLVKEGDIVERPPIVSFSVENRAVKFADGHIEEGVDNIIFCTGYLYSLPFLNKFCESKGWVPSPNATRETEPADDRLITTGLRIRRLYHQLFYIPDTSLSFISVPVRIIPFPMSECQAAVVAGVYSGRLKFPVTEEEMREWEKQRIEKKGPGIEYNLLNYPEDADYMDMLNIWNDQNPKPNGGGKLKPTRWGAAQRLVREYMPLMKVASMKAKIIGDKAPMTYADVGFDEVKGVETDLTKAINLSSA